MLMGMPMLMLMLMLMLKPHQVMPGLPSRFTESKKNQEETPKVRER